MMRDGDDDEYDDDDEGTNRIEATEPRAVGGAETQRHKRKDNIWRTDGT